MVDISEARQDVEKDYNAQEQQRMQANIDMRFISTPGGMWEDWLEATHGEGSERVRMEFDLTSDWVYRYYGQWVKNRVQVTFESDDDATSDDDAEMLSGVYRGDFRAGSGKEAQDTAVREAVITGFGAYKISEEFVDEEDPENDEQRIIWVPQHNAFNTVMFDCNAKRADKIDATRAQALTAYTHDAYEREFPGLDATSGFTPSTRGEFTWWTPEQIYVVERYEVSHEKQMMSVWQNVTGNKLQAYPIDDMEDIKEELKAFGWEHVRDRDIKRRIVEKSIFNGNDYIQEPKKIAGRWIPIVPIYAYRTFVDGAEYYWGLVRKLKDGNRTINMAISRMAESSATSGDAMPIFTEQQVRNRMNQLADRTDKNFMVINDIVDLNGNPIYSGPVGHLPPNQVDPNTLASIEVISNFIQQKTGGASQDTFDPDVSGIAVEKLVNEGNLSTVVIGDNILLSVEQDGRIYRDKASDLYTRPQMKRAVGEDGTSKIVKLNQKSIDPNTSEVTDMNNISKGRFAVHVAPGTSYDTQREATTESVEKMLDAVSVNPNLASKYTDTLFGVWAQNKEGPGLEVLKKKVRKNMILAGDMEPETDEEIQMLQQAQQNQQPDAQEQLFIATAEKESAEARNLDASAQSKQAVAVKDMTTAQKNLADAEYTKAQTAEIVVNINKAQQEGAAAEALARFARNTRFIGGQA